MDASDVALEATSWDDADALVSLRLRAMRASLERLGRFDPSRARARFLESFNPNHTWRLRRGTEWVGCVTIRHETPAVSWIEHFYIEPEQQGQGIGATVLALIISDAEATRRTLRLAVLKESDANRFYLRHGFRETHQEDWDVFYERNPSQD